MKKGLMVIVCGGVLLSVAIGTRHSFGIFLAPVTDANHWGREVFALTIALQNLIWGLSQPFTGALADRLGAMRVSMVCMGIYAIGLLCMSQAHTPLLFTLAGGLLVGIGLSGASFSIIFAAIGRTVSAGQRSMAMGIAGAAGSFGQFAMLPVSGRLLQSYGWDIALILLAGIMLLTIPFALGMRADRGVATSHARVSVREAFSQAIQYRDFWLLCLGFFVCGFQVVFISLHLPAYITDLGVSAGVGVTALALIGLFNIIGTLLAGYFGGKRDKSRLLVFLYLMRALIIVAFLLIPISDWTVYLFAALIGLFWLGTVPLTNGLVATMFGVGHMSMLTGIVFLSHQIGSFLGGWLGGAVFDATGSYLPVWAVAVGLSLMAAGVHAFIRDQPAKLEAVSA